MQIKDLVLKQIKGFWGEESDCEKGTPVIKTNNLSYEGSVDYTDINYREIDREKIKDNYLKKGDLLIEKSGGTKSHSVGYVSYYDGVDCKYVCNNFILCIRPDASKCVSKYLFYQIKYKYENGKFNNCFKQTTGIQNLKVEDYLSKQITYHDLKTQQKIVEELDCLSDIIEKKKQQLADLDNLVKSQFIKMFDGCATIQKSLGELSDISSGDSLTSLSISDKYSEVNKYLVYGANGVRGYYSEANRHNKSILVGRVGAQAGNVHYYDGDIFATEHALVVKVNKTIVEPEWLSFVLKQRDLFSIAKGAAQPVISSSNLKKEIIDIPDIKLQIKYLDFVHLIDKSKSDIKQSIEETQNLFNERMQYYFGD